MNSLRDIKQRIGNIDSTKQIIRAMDMIASTKLQKVRVQLEGVRPITAILKELLKNWAAIKMPTPTFFTTTQVLNPMTHYI